MSKKVSPRVKLPPISRVIQPVVKTTRSQSKRSIVVPNFSFMLTPAIDQIYSRKTSVLLNQSLIEKRKEGELIAEKFQQEWKKLETMERNLQRTIIAHNKFLRRNLEKRERAVAKMRTDAELIKKRERDLNALKHNYEMFSSVLNHMKEQIRKHNIYERYLDRVLNHEDSPMKTTHEFLMRLEILLEIKESCHQRQHKEMTDTLEMNFVNLEFFRQHEVAIIGMKNELNTLMSRYEKVSRETIIWEMTICDIENKCNQITYETDCILDMIKTIYTYIYRRRTKSSKIKEIDVEGKFKTIKQTLATWDELKAKFRRKYFQKSVSKINVLSP